MEVTEGKYLGTYKSDGLTYYMFSPQEVKEGGKTRFFRVGDDEEEYGSNTKYILIKVNKQEQKLINEAI